MPGILPPSGPETWLPTPPKEGLLTTPFRVEAALGDSAEAWQTYAQELRDEMRRRIGEAQQKAYVRKRRARARKIGRPHSGDIPEPAPAVLDGADPEEG